VEVEVTFPDISFFCCLHGFVVFLETLLSSVGNYLKYSWGVFAPRDRRLAYQFTFSRWISYSRVRF